MMIRRSGSSPSDRVVTPSVSASASWTILRSDDDIGSSARAVPGALHLVGHLGGEPAERLPATHPVAADVDTQAGAVVAETAL